MVASERCSSLCLQEQNVPMLARCIDLTRACATMCELTARLMWSNSELTPKACALCRDMCLACIKECLKHEHDHCKVCAEACQICADACSKLLANNQFALDLNELV